MINIRYYLEMTQPNNAATNTTDDTARRRVVEGFRSASFDDLAILLCAGYSATTTLPATTTTARQNQKDKTEEKENIQFTCWSIRNWTGRGHGTTHNTHILITRSRPGSPAHSAKNADGGGAAGREVVSDRWKEETYLRHRWPTLPFASD